MKLLLASAFLLLAGCSSSMAPTNPFAPGGQFYVAPGTFTGVWSLTYYPDSVPRYTGSCTAVVLESDSEVLTRITIDSTRQVFDLGGPFGIFCQCINPPPIPAGETPYTVSLDSGSIFGDSDYIIDGVIDFHSYGDSMRYYSRLDIAAGPQFNITCVRNK